MSIAISIRSSLLRERVSSRPKLLWALFLGAFISSTACATPPSAKDAISNQFWGNLYKKGGQTFYCKKSFSKKNPLIAASYIYPQGSIRQHLGCGTKRQCLRDSAEYNRIASDLHNVVPADSYFEMKRTNTVFGALDSDIEANDCGIKRMMHIIEPPAAVRGDIARVIFYMHQTYNLPVIGSPAVLEAWNKIDPPSADEIARSKQIYELQGNANPLLSVSNVASHSSMNDNAINVN
ncbi:hypothetical protein A3742_16160 [Oleiphilus sp. HI0071]|uniref:endonuclease n=1 Tax=unclassified Oleiphilus TaxID=2631174 RepID=UPI0007C3A50A|nr:MULTISPECIES: endonuclease [unclassified Oleiphilus]KZY70145.1 hypothetical protein A3737_12245 [Oleiphilus sp. HI0065]KZY83387.1 hypothetical protein A3742_07280 [Oleiphilus sp. HI0071]KZY91057.1 hypothetical protein A3744_04075 [Oleiphilus sp. HI0073]KZZ42080.1 hypothetical protein A3758_05725 [Oleiphilus sp. HI0118]KZZ60472.1 hypothetical protein A3760_06350 [Oleiphilus sp. HI0122]KZZ64674.1 hypothetical protein A3765_06715 [Oleiphilus sp. HI0130]